MMPEEPRTKIQHALTASRRWAGTDWTAQCEAKCRKTGERCPHRCTSQFSNTLANYPVCDGNQFTIHGRPVRLCEGHSMSFIARKKRLLTLPLIDGGHLSPWNASGYGSIVVRCDRIDFTKTDPVKIPKAWGAVGAEGNVPTRLLEAFGLNEKGEP